MNFFVGEIYMINIPCNVIYRLCVQFVYIQNYQLIISVQRFDNEILHKRMPIDIANEEDIF